MPTSPHSHKVAIPDSLRHQLADFRRHLWRVKVVEAVAAGLIGLFVSFLLVYGLDRVWQTPGSVRLGILIGGGSLFGVFAPYWIHRWVWRQRRDTQLARLIAKRYPGLGDRLLGVIELQDQQGSADSLSPRLREAAMAAVAAETHGRQLDEALPLSKHRRWALVAMALAVVSTATFTLTPQAGWNALKRWLMPLSHTERYTFTKLENPPSYRAVAFGEAFEVTLRLARDSEQRPVTAVGRYGSQPALSTALDADTYHFMFPGQQDPGTIVFHIGDLRHALRIEPLLRATTESVHAMVTPPAYLGIARHRVDLNTGVLSAVEASTVRIELTMTRPLATGAFGPTRSLATESVNEQPGYAPLGGPLEIANRLITTPEITIGAVPFEIPFAWTDQLGLTGDAGFRVRVDAFKDAPPTCYLQGLDRQKVMLPEETLDFELLAEDDFGVLTTGIEWSGQFTRPTDATPARGELKLADGAPDDRHLLKSVAFCPAAMAITPQKITLRAYVADRFPGRRRVYSESVTLFVLTRDEHAQMLKSRFDRQITELEDLARRELNLLEENERLERLTGSALQQNENRKRLESQQQEEAETQRRTEDLTQQLEQLMKDAARNGDIDHKTLKKIAESLKSLQELSQQDVPKVRDKLAASQEPSNTSEKSAQDVDQAVEEQKKVVTKMQQAIDQANDANRRFEAGTFVNRLKKAASDEQGIVGSLKDGFARMLGVKHSALDPSDSRRLDDNARQQTDTATDVRWIQEDLGHYFVRTKTESFKVILDAMHQSSIDLGLEEVRTLLASNHSYQAAENAKKWADQLMEWAGKLEGDKDKKGGAGGGDGGGPSPEDEDFEFMLRVMKMIQQQQDLRSRTRVLEQLRRPIESHPPPATRS
ncbi:MAG: hypothetical protein RLZZ282_4 [Verrucomicrobiota bacterium]